MFKNVEQLGLGETPCIRFKGLSWAPLLQGERQGCETIMDSGVKQTQVQNWLLPLLGLCDLNFSFLTGQVKLIIPVSEDFPED